MNQEWGHKIFYTKQKLHLSGSFFNGIEMLLSLRKDLIDELIIIKNILSKEDYSIQAIFPKRREKSKPIGYLLFFFALIEDVCTSYLINKEDTLIYNKYKDLIGLTLFQLNEDISEEKMNELFININIESLYNYLFEVYRVTNESIKIYTYASSKIPFDSSLISSLKEKDLLPTKTSFKPFDIKFETPLDLLEGAYSRIWIIKMEEIIKIIKNIKHNKTR